MLRTKQEFYKVKSLIEDILEQTGYMKELQAEGTDEALDRMANVDELLNKAALYDEKTENPTLDGFLEEVALVADIDNLEEDADHVVMMTLHSARDWNFRSFSARHGGWRFPELYDCFLRGPHGS